MAPDPRRLALQGEGRRLQRRSRRRLHDTRHTFASILLMAGESPQYVKEQLGHSSIKITVDVYGPFIPGANRQAVNKLPYLGTPTAKVAHTK